MMSKATKGIATAVSIGVALAFAPVASAQAGGSKAGDKIADSYICVFKVGAVGRGAEQSSAAAAVNSVGGAATQVYTTAIKGFAARMPANAVERIMTSNPNIDYCEQDQVMSLIPVRAEAKPSRGGSTTQPSQATPWGVSRVLNGKTPPAGPFATSWVIDTGIEPTHPDLRVDTKRSRSFVSTTSYVDQNGHGTHVAGTIGALNNTIGVVGVAPGSTQVAVRVLDKSGSGSMSGVIAGVDYVANLGVAGDVANMSLGGGANTSLDTAVANAAAKGIRFILAAGNSGLPAANSSPARVNGPNIFTVSAFASGDSFASFSNYGNPPIDYAQPGVSVRSTWIGGGYNTISGTSMAAPHLAGLLLLGPISDGGRVTGDKDATPDVIAVH